MNNYRIKHEANLVTSPGRKNTPLRERLIALPNPRPPDCNISGVSDTSGSDSLLLRMLAIDQNVSCLHHPPVEYASLNINVHDAIRSMCRALIDNCCNSTNCNTVKMIKPVTIPTEVDGESIDVKLRPTRCTQC